MPPTKKAPSPLDTVSVLQENIRQVAKEVRATSSKVVRFTASVEKQKFPPRENPYARELFFCKTNVRQVAREAVESSRKDCRDPEQIEKASKSYRYKLFRVYVEEPRKRVLNPLYKVKFENAYYEYRCHLALAKSLYSEEDYQDYRVLLDRACVPECWVDMSKNNLWMYHQSRVETQMRRMFKNWNSKMENLPKYVMNELRRHEERQAKKRENRRPELLDALLNRSNAPEFMPRKKIEDFHQTVFASKPVPNFLLPQWLVFQDDELNRKYGLGRYLRPPADEGSETDSEAIVGITPLDRSVAESESARSEGSEIDQMRSEMAMTQPPEVILPGAGGPGKSGPFYQNTEEVITALEPTQQQRDEAFALEPVASFGPPDDPMDGGEQPQVIVQAGQEDEPMPQQREPEPAVTERQSGEEGSDFSLLTPGQQEVIVITDDSPEPSSNEASSITASNIKVEVDFWTNLENVRKFTNIDKFIANSLRKAFKGKTLENKLAKLDKYVEHYFNDHLETFRAKRLPDGMLKLSRKERREREGVVPQPTPTPFAKEPAFAVPVPALAPAPAQKTQTRPVTATPEPLSDDAMALVPFRDTPRPIVPTVARRINYENSPESFDTMPNSENFLPEICSTQVPSGEPMIGAVRHPGTPRPSPQRPALPEPRAPPQRQSVDSLPSTPAFAVDNLNDTVLKQSPRRRRRSSPRVKIERDHSGYEDDVEEIPITNDPIILDDSVSQSQTDPDALIDKAMARDDGAMGVPLGMQKRVAKLFKKQNAYDTTQTSQSSEGSSGGKPVLSQDHQSMGFRDSQS